MSPLTIEKGTSKHSAYDLRSHLSEELERHTLAVVVDNEAGVLLPQLNQPSDSRIASNPNRSLTSSPTRSFSRP